MLTGELTFLETKYPVIITRLSKKRTLYIVLSQQALTDNDNRIKRAEYYFAGGTLTPDYIIGMADVEGFKVYGSASLVITVLRAISEHRAISIRNNEYVISGSSENYYSGDSYITYINKQIDKVKITQGNLQLRLEKNPRLSIPKNFLRKIHFKTTNSMELRLLTFPNPLFKTLGIDSDLAESGMTLNIQSLEEFENVFIRSFILEHQEWRRHGKVTPFIVTMTFEKNTLEQLVYMTISFNREISFGFFFGMKHFRNVDINRVADYLTNMFKRDPLHDREIDLVSSEGFTYSFRRSEVAVVAHNVSACIKLCKSAGADIWFDACSSKTTGLPNGNFKNINYFIKKTLSLIYPEQKDIYRREFLDMFDRLSDPEMVRFYGGTIAILYRAAVERNLDDIRFTETLLLNLAPRFEDTSDCGMSSITFKIPKESAPDENSNGWYKGVWCKLTSDFWSLGWIQNNYIIPKPLDYGNISFLFQPFLNPISIALLIKAHLPDKITDVLDTGACFLFKDPIGQSCQFPIRLFDYISEDDFCQCGDSWKKSDLIIVKEVCATRYLKKILFHANDGNKRIWWVERILNSLCEENALGILFDITTGVFNVKESPHVISKALSALAYFISKEIALPGQDVTLFCNGRKFRISCFTYLEHYCDEKSFIESAVVNKV